MIWLKNDPRSDHDLIFFDQIMPISAHMIDNSLNLHLFFYTGLKRKSRSQKQIEPDASGAYSNSF